MKRRRKTHRRGRTRAGRLNLADRFLQQNDLLPRPGMLVAVDLGYGDSLGSTLELARWLLELGHPQRVYAVEEDEFRVRNAESELHASTNASKLSIAVRRGGFDLRESDLHGAHLIRCFNVLRGYGLEEAATALRLLASQLLEGGLLVEGTSDACGHILGCHLWKRQDHRLLYSGLLLATDFDRGFSPRMFRDVLPRDLRRNFHRGEPVFEFLTRWEMVAEELRKEVPTERTSPRPGLDRMFERSLKRLKTRFTTTDSAHFALLEKGQTQTQEGAAQSSRVRPCAALWTPDVPSSRAEVLSAWSFRRTDFLF